MASRFHCFSVKFNTPSQPKKVRFVAVCIKWSWVLWILRDTYFNQNQLKLHCMPSQTYMQYIHTFWSSIGLPAKPHFTVYICTGLPLTFRLRKSQTSYTSDLEVPQENLGSPTFSVLQQAALCFAKHRFLFQCHTESSWPIILSDVF